MPTVQTRLGAIEGVEHPGAVSFLGIPYATPPVGERRLASSGTARTVVRHAARHDASEPGLPDSLPRGTRATGWHSRGAERGHAVPQRPHAGRGRRAAARHVLHPRRRLHGGLRQRLRPLDLRGRERHRRDLHQLSARHVRVPRSQPFRAGVRRQREPRLPGPDRGAPVGARQRRGLRRRPGQRDPLRLQRRGRFDHGATVGARRAGTVPPRHRHEPARGGARAARRRHAERAGDEHERGRLPRAHAVPVRGAALRVPRPWPAEAGPGWTARSSPPGSRKRSAPA